MFASCYWNALTRIMAKRGVRGPRRKFFERCMSETRHAHESRSSSYMYVECTTR
jgi:hypothetical protein